MKKIWLISFLFIAFSASAQERVQTVSMDSSDIDQILLKGRDQATFEKPKSLAINSFAEQLRQQNGVFIKEGSGLMLSSLRIAGASAAQTAVVWNGLCINSPTNGQVDISLMPSALFGAHLLTASSAQYGSSSMAGVLLMGNQAHKEKLILQQQLGSFGAYQGKVLWQHKVGKVNQTVGLQYQEARNNYTFKNRAVQQRPLDTLHNADGKIVHFTHDIHWELKRNYQLKTAFWFTNAYRSIPSTLLEGKSASFQQDETYRANISLIKALKKVAFICSNSVSIEHLKFTLQNAPVSNFKTYAIVNELKSRFQLGKGFDGRAGLMNENRGSIIPFFSHRSTAINNTSVWFTVAKKWKKWNGIATLNQGYYSLGYAPLTSKLEIQYQKGKWMLGINTSNNFRAPTINDLYWNPGGNINLKPEMGLQQGLYTVFVPQLNSKTRLKLKLDNRLMAFTNQIVWVYGNAFWSPQNMNKTLHLTSQLSYELERSYAKWDFAFIGNVNLTRAAALVEQKMDERQLFYIPYLTGNNQLSFNYMSFGLQLSNQFQGFSFADPQNTQVIAAFSLYNATISKNITIKKTNTLAYFSVNNLANTYYEVTLWRPMPRRNIAIGLKLTL